MKKYIVLQEDESDCGSCALKSVILYYKGYVPLEIIKVDTKTNESGTNFLYMKQASEKYGFDSSGKYTFDFKDIIYPCIAQVNINGYNHFVTLFEVNDTVKMIDPSKGEVILNKDQFLKIYTGYILELIPKTNIIKYKKNKRFINIIKNIYKNNLKELFILFFIIFALIILSLISNFNLILIQKNKLILVVVFLTTIKVLINYIKNIKMSHLNKNINDKLLKSYISYIFNLPFKYLQIKKSGDLLNRVNDLNNIKDFFSSIIIDFIINILFLITTVILLFILNNRVTLILILISFLYFFILFVLNKKLYLKINNMIDSGDNVIDVISEYLNKIKTIKTLKIDNFINNINNKIDINLNTKLSLDIYLSKLDLIKNIFDDLMFLIIIILFISTKKDYLTLIIFISIYNYYKESLNFFGGIMPSLLYFKDILNRIKSIFDLEPDINNINYTKKGHVIVNNLNYSYNTINSVITNLSFKINKGDKVFLKGDNGSGKSTLLSLLTNETSDYKGNIKIGGKVSYLSQNSDLFNDSIINNIILDKKYNENRFNKIKNILYLDNIILNKPKGYNTKIESLSNLSGGEKQKILIARSLYINFDILIMDESLSEISDIQRDKILNNILNYYKNKTIIYVSHQKEIKGFNKQIFLTAREENYVNK